MLNRRHLRIKIFQVLYAFYSSKNDLFRAEKEMMYSMDKVYDLYIHLLLVFNEFQHIAEIKIEEAKNKNLQENKDLSPNLKFVNNKIIQLLSINKELEKEAKKRKINWIGEDEQGAFRKMFVQFRNSSEYMFYMSDEENNFQQDYEILEHLLMEYIVESEYLLDFFEDKNVYWGDDLNVVTKAVLRTLKSFNENSTEYHSLLNLYKDEDDDIEFIKRLLKATIRFDEDSTGYIDKYSKNWDVDRISLSDIILMKMGMAEVREFSNIPVKVTMNEYIELSKDYSTPKSKSFINGVLDKSFADMKSEGLINKSGRGLLT